ncbi:MAG: hypothetical protein U9O94_02205 [Nanoarchaeota archaeon]|nr:hypothetical protein [Nanoarchaeota archaeon]
MKKLILMLVAIIMLLVVPSVASAEYRLEVSQSGSVYRIDSRTGRCWILRQEKLDGATYFFWQFLIERGHLEDIRERGWEIANESVQVDL